MSDLSQLASDLARLHVILSVEDGEPDRLGDLRFEATIRRRLNRNDPAQERQLRQIASEVAKLVSL